MVVVRDASSMLVPEDAMPCTSADIDTTWGQPPVGCRSVGKTPLLDIRPAMMRFVNRESRSDETIAKKHRAASLGIFVLVSFATGPCQARPLFMTFPAETRRRPGLDTP